MSSSENKVQTYSDVSERIVTFLEKYIGVLFLFLMTLSGFNFGVGLTVLTDYAAHISIQLIYKEKREFSYSCVQWIKKSIMMACYQYSLGSNSQIPTEVFVMLHVIIMNSITPDELTKKWRSTALTLLTLESGVTMYYFSGCSIQYIIGMIGFTLFFLFYILNMIESLAELIERLQEQYLSYKNLVEFIHGSLVTMDEDLTISYVNKQILNFKPDDLVGKKLSEFPFYDKQKINLLKRTKKRQNYYWKTVSSNGELFWFVVDATIQYSSLKNSNEIAFLIQDVSLEKKIEEKEKINIQNAASLKAKNEFIASISHEIRNPLQVISYSSENLLSKNLISEVKQTVQDINFSTKFLTTIIGDILDYSKIEAGEMKISEKKFDILSLVETAIRMNSKSCLEKDLKMDLDFDFSLPKFFVGDSTRILQILNNFITNAIKYTNKGGVQIKVCKTINEDNSKFLYFSCRDTGRGISKQNLKILFDPFIQLHHKKYSPNSFKGWGLGLSICKKLLHLMNGEFGVESEMGKGSLFWFKLSLENMEEVYLSYQEEFKNLKIDTKKFLIVDSNSDFPVADQMIPVLKLLDVNTYVVTPKKIEIAHNQLIFVENSLIKSIPENINQEQIVEITNDSTSKYQSLRYPVIPSDLLQLISRKNQQLIEQNSMNFESNLKIMVVDDNLLILKSLERLLKSLKVKDIKTAVNGKQAFDLINETDDVFDLVFMDISMPVMNGIEATKLIRNLTNEKKRDTLIYALTGNALMKSIEEQKLEWQMDNILSKPVNKQEIQEVLQHVAQSM